MSTAVSSNLVNGVGSSTESSNDPQSRDGDLLVGSSSDGPSDNIGQFIHWLKQHNVTDPSCTSPPLANFKTIRLACTQCPTFMSWWKPQLIEHASQLADSSPMSIAAGTYLWHITMLVCNLTLHRQHFMRLQGDKVGRSTSVYLIEVRRVLGLIDKMYPGKGMMVYNSFTQNCLPVPPSAFAVF